MMSSGVKVMAFLFSSVEKKARRWDAVFRFDTSGRGFLDLGFSFESLDLDDDADPVDAVEYRELDDELGDGVVRAWWRSVVSSEIDCAGGNTASSPRECAKCGIVAASGDSAHGFVLEVRSCSSVGSI